MACCVTLCRVYPFISDEPVLGAYDVGLEKGGQVGVFRCQVVDGQVSTEKALVQIYLLYHTNWISTIWTTCPPLSLAILLP